MTRLHRVHAFCDWLETIPAWPPFETREEYRFFADLTDGEMMEARLELLRRRAALKPAQPNDNDDWPDSPEAA